MLTQLAAACAALSVWAFAALARWRFDDTGDRVTASQESVEKAILAMGNRGAIQYALITKNLSKKLRNPFHIELS